MTINFEYKVGKETYKDMTLEVDDKFKAIDFYDNYPEDTKLLQEIKKICRDACKGRKVCIITTNGDDIIWEGTY